MKTFTQFLTESNDFPKKLYHASHTGNLKDIQAVGLCPQHGEIVQSTESYQTVVGEWGEELPEVVFFGTDPGFVQWQVGNFIDKGLHDVTNGEILRHGVVCIIDPTDYSDEIYRSNGDGTATNYDGEKIYDIPPHVESVDFFSFSCVEPEEILVGEEMMLFMRQNFPKELP